MKKKQAIGIKAIFQDHFICLFAFFFFSLPCFNSNFYILLLSIDPLVDT